MFLKVTHISLFIFNQYGLLFFLPSQVFFPMVLCMLNPAHHFPVILQDLLATAASWKHLCLSTLPSKFWSFSGSSFSSFLPGLGPSLCLLLMHKIGVTDFSLLRPSLLILGSSGGNPGRVMFQCDSAHSPSVLSESLYTPDLQTQLSVRLFHSVVLWQHKIPQASIHCLVLPNLCFLFS